MVFLLKATLGAAWCYWITLWVQFSCPGGNLGVNGAEELESVGLAMRWILALPCALEAIAEQWLKKQVLRF